MGGDPPKAHVGFNQDQITHAARVGRARSRLEHIPAILRVEHWGDDATWAQGGGKKRKSDISGRRSGNEDDERLRQGSNSRGFRLRIYVIRQGLQFGQNRGLAKREHGIFGVWVELHYHVLDLQRAGMSVDGRRTPK